MDELNVIYATIAAGGFSAETLQKIDNLTNDIRYGRKNFIGFTLSEHAGLCKGGAPLIGASIVVSYARRSLTTSGNAEISQGQSKSSAEISSLDFCRDAACARSIEQGSSPANWQIDEEHRQEPEGYGLHTGMIVNSLISNSPIHTSQRISGIPVIYSKITLMTKDRY